ncbi:MAG TPA: prephenate dehydrogenase/arogenate dehydrogenase family protein, partial [Phycisphaerales bacterium]|nr:prephenate dehydrogenase/arogenate dehydrogenase family protein [Phycisphaerales bacterium]
PGSERKGVAFARADLFDGATCIVTPTRHTPPKLVARAEALWRSLGMRTLRLAPAAHDRAVARVSHLPHALAALLMMLPGDADLPVAATGFRDATRLASGDPEMWRDIFLTNRAAVLEALDRMDRSLAGFRKLVDEVDADGIEKFLARAKARRDGTVARTFSDRRVAME